MTSLAQSTTQDSFAYARDPVWSKSEKAIARKAFHAALKQELHERMQEAKRIASQINEPADLWELEHYLTERRKDDRKYDYRYSQLTDVFGRLLYEGRLSEEHLHGLREDKLKAIRSFATFLARWTQHDLDSDRVD